MKKRFSIRKVHRYLGIIIGIQFFLWALGGVYFAWTDLDQIHSDPYKSPPVNFDNSIKLSSPQVMVDQLSKEHSLYKIEKLELLGINGSPSYRIGIAKTTGSITKYFLADAATGKLRPQLNREESVKLAVAAFRPDAPVKSVEYLTDKIIGKHHEYRGRILPAYAISFGHKSGVTIYVSPEMAQVITFRNSNWRIFDLLWMFHTMDYNGRDNFNNWLLRIMGVLGIITVLSGFVLFLRSRNSYKE
ncbi:MAG: PepSY domain-containing protein [Acidobacteriota bacterium]